MTMRKIILCLLLIFTALGLTACGVTHQMPEEPGKVIIEDDANLFDERSENELRETMEELSEYGNVGVYTCERAYDGSISRLARDYYDRKFNTESGFVFIIDMYNRYIYIETDGYIGDFVTPSKADSITDNVYSLASSRQYSLCAKKAVTQALNLVKGKHVPQTMRLISSIFVAALCALMLNFAVLRFLNRKPEVSIGQLSLAVKGHARFANEQVNVTERSYQNITLNKTNTALLILRILLIILSSGGGGRSGGGRSGGGRSGGGGHHGGHGGGHRF